MTALTNNSGNILVATDFTTQNRTTGLNPYEACSLDENDQRVEIITIRNPTTVTIVATLAIPLPAQEATRTYTSTDTGVSGNTASSTGAIYDTLTMTAGSVVTYTLTSTWNSPTDYRGEAVPFATVTRIATITETTQDSTDVTDRDPLGYPLRPVKLGTPIVRPPNLNGESYFSARTPSVSQVIAGLVSRMTDAQTQEVIDLVEGGLTLYHVLLATKLFIAPGINIQTDDYTILQADFGKRIGMNKGSGNTLTIPKDQLFEAPVGTVIPILQIGAGATTVAAGSGATLTVDATFTKVLAGAGSMAFLLKTAANTWYISGDLVAA